MAAAIGQAFALCATALVGAILGAAIVKLYEHCSRRNFAMFMLLFVLLFGVMAAAIFLIPTWFACVSS